ncbi:universal stress protein [Acidiferrimicrobium sp. IK]|uniref:universal stress protein n=1 Tax=Acidiferrimicrobium sp. IK TaxID=2871700 RepID=UPI0021CB4025|nr:universal stress protein [Acidiferrimicrobium sp. IK]MCU4182997.1 universal stress protein [Acidiferrimicrobium sp. IK]
MSSFGFAGAVTPCGGRSFARRVEDAIPRAGVVVSGTVRAVDTVAYGSGPAYCCTLDDGTGQLELIFLGRTSVAGLIVGARCTVQGTARLAGDRLAVWNPLYRLDAPTPPAEANRGPSGAAPAAAPSPPPARGVETLRQAPPEPRASPSAAEPGEVSDAVEPAGHFRIYLGATAGVGKTVAMLDEALRRQQRGADVVVGIVETHGRPVTRARTAGLEVVPRRPVRYRGAMLEEMDLDAVIRRHPQVVLVDELAHTNVPGSGIHEKRWQDVLQLLEAGIDVISTVNIQHLESIADAVERITGTAVRERVPDWVVRRADQIELVDSSPEQLRRRMLHGNIYPPDKVPQALTNFFRVENLIALRELALRFLADETEEELLEYLRGADTDEVWDTAERFAAAVTTAPGTDAIIRRAARMAARNKADLQVVHVRSGDTRRPSDDGRLEYLRQVASGVGAGWHEIDGDEPGRAIIDFARQHQITQIVIGSTQRSRWRELIGGGSVVKRISRLAAEAGVDVRIIARRRDPAGVRPGETAQQRETR